MARTSLPASSPTPAPSPTGSGDDQGRDQPGEQAQAQQGRQPSSRGAPGGARGEAPADHGLLDDAHHQAGHDDPGQGAEDAAGQAGRGVRGVQAHPAHRVGPLVAAQVERGQVVAEAEHQRRHDGDEHEHQPDQGGHPDGGRRVAPDGQRRAAEHVAQRQRPQGYDAGLVHRRPPRWRHAVPRRGDPGTGCSGAVTRGRRRGRTRRRKLAHGLPDVVGPCVCWPTRFPGCRPSCQPRARCGADPIWLRRGDSDKIVRLLRRDCRGADFDS